MNNLLKAIALLNDLKTGNWEHDYDEGCRYYCSDGQDGVIKECECSEYHILSEHERIIAEAHKLLVKYRDETQIKIPKCDPNPEEAVTKALAPLAYLERRIKFLEDNAFSDRAKIIALENKING